MVINPNDSKLNEKNIIVFDVETENTGSRVLEDSSRIISIQIADVMQPKLYYADSKDPEFSLVTAKSRIEDLVSNGYIFSGFFIRHFDVPILDKFLKIKIPEPSILDLASVDIVVRLGRPYSLESVCTKLGIEVPHKQRMNEKADSYKTRPDILTQAKQVAPKIAKEKGGTIEYAFDEAVKKIARGHAIYDSYKEFVEKDGSKDTIFYEYAIGDVICEYRLLEILRQSS